MTVISRLLGHGSTDVTEKVNAKFLPQTLTAEVERLGYAFLPRDWNNLDNQNIDNKFEYKHYIPK